MSVKATNFVRSLRGLTPTEKLVAFVFADHDSFRGHGSYPGMNTVAAEAELKNRETASRITKKLVSRGILLTDAPSKGGRGKTTVYRLNYDLVNCDSPVTVSTINTVTSASTNCDFGSAVSPETVTLEAETVTPQSQEGFEGLEEKGKREEEPKTLAPTFSESGRPLSEQEIQALTEKIKTRATKIDSRIDFSKSATAEIKQVVSDLQPTESEVLEIVERFMEAQDDFKIANAGSSLANSLRSKIQARREIKSDRIAQDQAMVASTESHQAKYAVAELAPCNGCGVAGGCPCV